jgi:LysR family transcriptional activator of nhaA
MNWLNYHHLHYFWVAARERSVTKAAKQLRLAQPTVSEQIRQLEEAIGTPLFVRSGRELALTEAGRTAMSYADEIFSLGQQMLDVLSGARPAGKLKLVVGVTDSLPKLIVYRLLEPALRLTDDLELYCREDHFDALLGELAIHTLDLVLADTPLPPHSPVKAFNHPLGDSTQSFFAAPKLARNLRRSFPDCLDGAPMLYPPKSSPLRAALDGWLQRVGVRPRFVGEFEDSALAKAFGHAGMGVFAAPTAIEREIERQYEVTVLGRVDDLKHRFYAISLERRIKHPGVAAISAAAHELLVDT